MEISNQQYTAAFNGLPKPIRAYLLEDDLARTLGGIAARNNLHVDVSGTLSKSATYMLMGLQSPAETLGELVMAGIDSETAKKILASLNEEIFIPVRERVRNFKEEDEDSAEEIVEAPRDLVETYQPTTISSVATEEPLTPPTPTAVPAPAPVSVVPRPAPVVPTPPPTPAPAIPAGEYHPQMRTMATDIEAVREHRMPEPISVAHTTPPVAPIMPPAPPQVVTPPPMPPAPPPQIAPVRPMPPPPPNLPGAPVVKSYSVDPYREPVE